MTSVIKKGITVFNDYENYIGISVLMYVYHLTTLLMETLPHFRTLCTNLLTKTLYAFRENVSCLVSDP